MIDLHHGDCLEIMKQIPDNSVDLILCDLPYGTTKCKWDEIILFEPLWKQYNRIAKEKSPFLLFGTEPFSSKLRCSNIENFRYDWYWRKNRAANFLFGNKMPLKNIEVLSVFYRKQPIYNAQKIVNPMGISKRHLYQNPAKISQSTKEIMGETWKETVLDSSLNYSGKNYEPDKLLPKQLIDFVCVSKKEHPTQKPVALMEYMIKTYTNEGMTVLDNCMGSGTTGITCLNTNRNFIGIEKDDNYFKLAKERIEKHIKSDWLEDL